jgi:hypothetical protein
MQRNSGDKWLNWSALDERQRSWLREFEPTAQSIWNWVRQADRDDGRRQDGATSGEREEPTRLRRENRQLRQERDILAEAAAWETTVIPPGLPIHEREPSPLSHRCHPRSMPATLPVHSRAGNKSPTRNDDDACQSFHHIGSQYRVKHKLRLLWAASRSLGMPLRHRRAILQAAASGRSIASQLPRFRRSCASKPARNVPHAAALHSKKCDFFPLRK